jgi:ADP-ribose pyrophosphatase
MDEKGDLPERLGRKTVYDSSWLKLHLDKVRQPDGTIIDDFHLVDYPIAAVGAVVQNEEGKLVLCRVPRYTTMTNHWTVPAGGVEPGESPTEAARREVWEETGYDSTDHDLVYSFFPQQGSSNKQFHIVFCKAAKQTGKFDPAEISEVRLFSRNEVEELIDSGELDDGLGLTALLLWLRKN